MPAVINGLTRESDITELLNDPHGRDQYPLPAGLPDRTRTEIIGRQGHDVIVRDGAGTEWPLAHWQVDAGREYLSQKLGWLPESDPRVLDYLKRRLAKLRGEKWDFTVDSHRTACIEESAWVLERNGLPCEVTELSRAWGDSQTLLICGRLPRAFFISSRDAEIKGMAP